MDWEAQPVPPIFEPEIIANAIFHTAHHPRREVYVGWPTVKAILGQKLVPGYLDRYLADHGFDAQYTDRARDPSRPRNLFTPAPGDPGAHGRFDARARRSDAVTGITKWLGAAGVTATAAAAVVGASAAAALLVTLAIRATR
jgi:hypothetical protein